MRKHFLIPRRIAERAAAIGFFIAGAAYFGMFLRHRYPYDAYVAIFCMAVAIYFRMYALKEMTEEEEIGEE